MTLPTNNKSTPSVSPSDYYRNRRTTSSRSGIMADPSLFNLLPELPFPTSTSSSSYRLPLPSYRSSNPNHVRRSTAELIDEALRIVNSDVTLLSSSDEDEENDGEETTTTITPPSRNRSFKRQRRNDDDNDPSSSSSMSRQ